MPTSIQYMVTVIDPATSPPGPATATAVESDNQSLDHYFVTHIAAEIAILDAGITIQGWTRTGQSFSVYTAAGAGTSPVCRYYIPPGKGNSHFYGRGAAECNATGQANPSFVNEDPQFFHVVLPTAGVCPPGCASSTACSATGSTPITATWSTGRCATSWSPAAGSRRATDPISS